MSICLILIHFCFLHVSAWTLSVKMNMFVKLNWIESDWIKLNQTEPKHLGAVIVTVASVLGSIPWLTKGALLCGVCMSLCMHGTMVSFHCPKTSEFGQLGLATASPWPIMDRWSRKLLTDLVELNWERELDQPGSLSKLTACSQLSLLLSIYVVFPHVAPSHEYFIHMEQWRACMCLWGCLNVCVLVEMDFLFFKVKNCLYVLLHQEPWRAHHESHANYFYLYYSAVKFSILIG